MTSEGDYNNLHWSPPAKSLQNGVILDYGISCVIVKDGENPFDTHLHANGDTWSVMLSELGGHHSNDDPLYVTMPTTYPPYQLVSCRVAGINKDGRGPYEYHVTRVPSAGSYHDYHCHSDTCNHIR